MKQTPNLLLKMPEPADFVLVEDLNENFTKLDTEIAKITDEETGVEAQLNKHLDEKITSSHFVSRELNMTGVQTVTTIPNRKIQMISARAFVEATEVYSIGTFTQNHTHAITNIGNLLYPSTALIGINSGLSKGFYATVQNVQNGSFDLNWKTDALGSYDGIGQVSVQIDIIYHGEEVSA